MPEIVSFDASIIDCHRDLDRHERFASTAMQLENQQEALGEWNGLLESITSTRTELTKLSDSTADMKKSMGERTDTARVAASKGEEPKESVASQVVKALADVVEIVVSKSEEVKETGSSKDGKSTAQKSSDSLKPPGRTVIRRCGKCISCKGTCEGAQRDPCVWCDTCKKKKLGENTGNRSCKKRLECKETKQDSDTVKRKPDKSPDEKQKAKKSNNTDSEVDDEGESTSSELEF